MARITMKDSFKGIPHDGKPRRVANNTFRYSYKGDTLIRHQTTDIIRFVSTAHGDKIVLNSGGWRTVTTKDRINRFSPAQVWSERGVWTVSYDGKTGPFFDGMVLPDDLDSPEGEIQQAENKLLAKKINSYCRLPISTYSHNCDKCINAASDHCDDQEKGIRGGKPHMTREHAVVHLREDTTINPVMVNAALLWAGYTTIAIVHMERLPENVGEGIKRRALRRYLRLTVGL